ncbi:MAG: hypothetical protein DRN81_04335 [Thermoproteota archaeon]|nr:MAG: hypothetical protein DRN81_04335 [Candidatus Korarchaeota archaeon]
MNPRKTDEANTPQQLLKPQRYGKPVARIDVEWWLTQAKRDLKMAEILLREGYYEGSAYHSHKPQKRR